MDPVCGCGAPAPNATLCPSCAYRLDEHLARIAEHHGLAWDLDIARAGEARIVRNSRGRRAASDDVDQAPLARAPLTLHAGRSPGDARASDAAAQLHAVLARWAARVADETGVRSHRPTHAGPTCHTRYGTCRHPSCALARRIPPPPTTLPGLAAWLRPRVGWLRHHADGQTAYDQIVEAVRAARRAVDRPAEQVYAGPCDECDEDMYGRPGALIVECDGCHLVYEIEARRAWLLWSAEDVLATAPEIARAITRLGQPITAATIRGYVHRGRLMPYGQRLQNGRLVPLYRLGAVLDVLTPRHQPTGPVCITCPHPSCASIRATHRHPS
ncbi:hypothetical protein [Actinomadura flavalba]|uniref:hypothetical protein n=1 Tax=Actinomadura flavalba TaxID=1120938 RepID=UPI000377843D|nr:hypothetical protein [Actinomadura flavalba]